jgi:DNA-binding Lrp family transcriptional regulator
MADDSGPRNYTPVPDALVAKFGLIVAAVFGRMWRYAQMDSGVCMATQKRIADDLDLTRMTVSRSIKTLKQAGLIEDLDTGLCNQPHRFKVEWCNTELHQNSDGVTESYTRCNRELHQEAVWCNTELQEESIIKKDTKIAKKTQKKSDLPPPAVQILHANTQRYPVKSLYEHIAKEVGDKPADLEFWGSVIKNWLLMGWNKTNVKGMIDFYKRREIPPGNGKQPPKQTPPDTTQYQPVDIPAEGSIWGNE